MLKRVAVAALFLVAATDQTAGAMQNLMKDAYRVPHFLLCNATADNGNSAVQMYFLVGLSANILVYRQVQQPGLAATQVREISFLMPSGDFNDATLSSDIAQGLPGPNLDSIDCGDGRSVFELEEDGQAFDFF